jgi:hypothetical protein
MTQRMSSAQFTILKTMAPRHGSDAGAPLPFEKAVEFNQIMFYSLVRRGFIRLSLTHETFSLTKEGLYAYTSYARGDAADYVVKDTTEARHDRVSTKLIGQDKPQRKATNKTKAHAAA